MNKNFKAIAAAMVGNALEYYDVMLYGYFATMLAPLFFPAINPTLALLSSWVTFAAGFIMRPIGGIVFGHLGDKYGRRNALVLAIFLVTIPTFIIGLLPTYLEIGILSPIILIICRLFQGICVGGEYSGASIFVIEYSKRGKEAFAGGILAASGMFGGVLGTFFGYLCTLPFMPDWGWRIPFLLGAFMGLIGYYFRTKVGESPGYLQATHEKIEKVPLKSILLNRKINFFCTVGIGAATLIPLYIGTVYIGSVLTERLNMPTSKVMLIHVMISVFSVFAVSFAGYTADIFGKRNQMLFSATTLILIAYPLFSYFENDPTIFRAFFLQAILLLLNVAFVAPSMALLATYFPVHERYSGIGFGYALGGAIFGGTTPFFLTALVKWLGSPMIPAYYTIFSGALGMLCIYLGKTIYESSIKEQKVTKNLTLATSQI